MALWDRIAHFLALENLQDAPLTRAEPTEDFDTQLARLQGALARPWRLASIPEALGVPAIYRAVTLISTTVGALSLESYRDGVKLDARPRLIVRPNPFSTPREFFRETAYSMATRGEAWWWIAARDADGVPLSLYPMPANEVTVSDNDRDPLRPQIEWRGRKMRNEDVRQIVLSRPLGALRGEGPLQSCGAAVSVAVEAQEWAANFFAEGGIPSVIIQAAGALDPTRDADGYSEAELMKKQWAETPSNVPRVIDEGIKDVKDFGFDPSRAQLVESRKFTNGEAAVMFGIPGSLIDHFDSGSSLTYQNVSQEYDKFVRACLWPGYLEPIEQTISDLLTRSTVARFNVDGLLRADIKTRYEVYESGVTKSGVLTLEEARRMEGLAPGDVERAPVPFSTPDATPTQLPIQGRTAAVRCDGRRMRGQILVPCNKLLAESAPFTGRCPRCGKEHVAAA